MFSDTISEHIFYRIDNCVCISVTLRHMIVSQRLRKLCGTQVCYLHEPPFTSIVAKNY